MKYFIINFSICFLLLSFFLQGRALPPRTYKDSIYDASIKTVMLYQNNNRNTYPVLKFNSQNYLTLRFDDLNESVETYCYDFVHCDADWHPTLIQRSDYLTGFPDIEINDYTSSFNTLHSYVHYKAEFPNTQVQFKVPGNYVIKVYKDYNKDSVILTKRFYIVDPAVQINARIKRPTLSKYRNSHQEINFSINYENYTISNPFDEITVILKQNSRRDNLITDLSPTFVKQNELIYDYNERTMFGGGREFRYFSIEDMEYRSENVKDIVFKKPYYHVYLFKDRAKPYGEYFYHEDLNGNYRIYASDVQNSDTDADYVYVHFTLPYEAPLPDGNVYIFGALTNWNFTPRNRMNYNYSENAYKATLLLKQGHYNYQYAFLRKGNASAKIAPFEGNHYETENDYQIFIYQKRPGSRYEKLIGYERLNSLTKVR